MMPSHIYVRRDGQRLVPVSPIDAEAIEALATGKDYEITIKESRSLPQHSLYWAMLSFAANHLPEPPPETGMSVWPFDRNPEVLHREVKWQCGIVERHIHADGSSRWVIGSIAFSRMSQSAFARFFEHARMWLSQTFFQGRDVLEMMDAAGAMPEHHWGVRIKRGDVSVAYTLKRLPSGWQVQIGECRRISRHDFAGIHEEIYDSPPDAIEAIKLRIDNTRGKNV